MKISTIFCVLTWSAAISFAAQQAAGQTESLTAAETEQSRQAAFIEAVETLKAGDVASAKQRLRQSIDVTDRSPDWRRRYAQTLFDALIATDSEVPGWIVREVTSEAIPLLRDERPLAELDLSIPEQGSRAHDFYLLGMIHQIFTLDRQSAMQAYRNALKIEPEFQQVQERLRWLEMLEDEFNGKIETQTEESR